MHFKKLFIITSIIVVVIFLYINDFYNVEKMLSIARSYSDQWWLAVVLILLQVLLFTFALAGSLVFWIAATLYEPVTATFILAAGATLGGIGAYYFSRYITSEWIKKIEESHAYEILQKHDDFFALFALRVFPAFPHALVNYSSGILKVKLSHFIIAAFLGVGIKSYIYADIVYHITTKASADDLLNVSTILPLVILSLFAIIGVIVKFKLTK